MADNDFPLGFGFPVLSTHGRGARLIKGASPLLVGLNSFWPFNSSLKDVVGGNTLTAPNGESFIGGLIGNAVSLNGSNQYLVAPTQALPGTFWFGGWVNVASVVANARVFDWGSGTSDYTYLTLSNSDGKALVHFNGTVSQQLSCGVATPTSQWARYDVGLLNNGNLCVICMNGVMRNAAVPSGQIVPINGANNWFGQSQYYALGDPYLGGKLNQWGLWSRGLSLKELINLYAQGNGYAYPFGGVQTPVYVFCTWQDNSNGTGPLYLLTSYDSVNWEQQFSSYTAPSGDLIKDTSLHQVSSTNWWIAHTAQVNSCNYFDIAQTTTCGLTFGTPIQLSCAELSPAYVYAPRWAKDNNGVWGIIFSAQVSGAWGVYYKQPSVAGAFGGLWNNAVQITGTFASGCLDPSAPLPPALNPTGQWAIWTKSSATNKGGYSTSSSFAGPYTYQGDISALGIFDGPTPVQLSDRWRLFVDVISGLNPVGEAYFDSFDGWQTWSGPTNLTCTLLNDATPGLGHGTITTLN